MKLRLRATNIVYFKQFVSILKVSKYFLLTFGLTGLPGCIESHRSCHRFEAGFTLL